MGHVLVVVLVFGIATQRQKKTQPKNIRINFTTNSNKIIKKHKILSNETEYIIGFSRKEKEPELLHKFLTAITCIRQFEDFKADFR